MTADNPMSFDEFTAAVDAEAAAFAAALDEVESFTLAASTDDGETVTIEVTYPKGRAITGLRALREFSGGAAFAAILTSFAEEPSVAEAMAAAEMGGESDGTE